MIVGDAHGRPYASDRIGSLAEDLELPHLAWIGYGQTFARITIAIAFDELSHHTDGLTCGDTALQCQSLQLLYAEETPRVFKLAASGNGGFAHSELTLIKARICSIEESIRVSRLRYGVEHAHSARSCRMIGVHPSADHRHRRIALITGSRHYIHPCAVVAVASVGCYYRSVGRGLAAYHYAGAAHTVGQRFFSGSRGRGICKQKR